MYDHDQDPSDNETMDKELADLTDALFAGKTMTISDNVRDLDTISRELFQLIAPNTPPDPSFRARLTQRLNEEWAQAEKQRHQTRTIRPSRQQFLLIAAVLVLVIAVSVITFFQRGTLSVPGADVGNGSISGVLIVLAVLAIFAAIVAWRGRR